MGFLDKLSGKAARKKTQAEEHLKKGIAFSQREEWQPAIAEFKQAIELDPDFAKAHQLLALSYGAVMDRESAVKHYEKLKKLNPNLAQQLAGTPAFSFLLRGGPSISM